MAKALPHTSRVFSAPWRGVYGTYMDSGRHFGKHWHDTYGFGVLERGAHRSASGLGSVRAYAGDVITTNPGEVHDGRPLGGPTRRWRIVSIDVDVMATIVGPMFGHMEIVRPVIEDRALVQALGKLFRRLELWNALAGKTATNALAFEESLIETCAMLMARHGTAPASTEAPAGDMREVLDRLADETLATPTLADMATMTGLSRYAVLRRFEKVYGLPPHAWLLRLRAERARAFIRDGATLASAAAASGFADQSHMTRVFARQYGFTPGAWRRAVAPQ
jgi:AraC-like DNA-binding protein